MRRSVVDPCIPLWLALAVFGCGSVKSGDVDADADAASDDAAGTADASPSELDALLVDGTVDAGGAPPCTWSSASVVANINSSGYEFGPALSSDGTALLYDRLVAEGDHDIYIARRSSTTTAFGQGQPLTNVNTEFVIDSGAELSSTGLEMFFTRHVYETSSYPVWTARRDRTDTDFGGPGSVGVDGHSPEISANGLVLYYLDPATKTVRSISRPSVGGAWGGPRDVMANSTYSSIDISGDELRILLSGAPQGNAMPLAMAARNTKDEPFGPPAPIQDVLPAGTRTVSGASWGKDERELYFAIQLTSGAGAADIYLSICQ